MVRFVLLLVIISLIVGCGGGGGNSLLIAPVDTNTHYTVNVLSGSTEDSYVTVSDINNLGQIAGLNDGHAAVWSSDGSIQLLPDPPRGFEYGVVHGINDAGQVVGGEAEYVGQGILWDTNGQVKFVQYPDYLNYDTETVDINESGQILGWTNDIGCVVFNPNGTATVLSISTYTGYAGAMDINNAGSVVGGVYDDKAYYAVLWKADGSLTKLPRLPGTSDITAYAINNIGEVAGEAGKSGRSYPVKWDAGGRIHRLGLLPGTMAGEAKAINDLGQIVGTVRSFTNTREPVFHAVLWQPDGRIVDLGSVPGRSSSEAVAINNSGVIIGKSYTLMPDDLFGQENTWCPDNEVAVVWKPGH